MQSEHLGTTELLDFEHPSITALVQARGWDRLAPADKIGAAYEFVRQEIAFGYNIDDAIPASQVLAEGQGQCNTKGILLMALLRALGIACRFRGFAIDKSLQRGVVPELIYPLAPQQILHSWVEVAIDGQWIVLEGFIVDPSVLSALQREFGSGPLCGYGVGTNTLERPAVCWDGKSTYIQSTGIIRDFGRFDAPDAFFAGQKQDFGWFRGFLYRYFLRHWMNLRVARMRRGVVPPIPTDMRTAPGDTLSEELIKEQDNAA